MLDHDELIVVFGCGGDRDVSKRSLMGRIAEELADKVILTDDNPRNEKSEVIIRDILSGLKKSEKAQVVTDRATAIKHGITQAKNDDIVLIAGKGHEEYQIIEGRKSYFNDYQQAMSVLQELGASI